MEKKNKKSKDDRDLIPVSDLDEEMELPMVVKTKSQMKIVKALEQNLGYR